MLEVSFYTGVPDRLAFACRLLRKAQQSGAQVLVYGPHAALSRLDAALWTFEPTEFVPHVLDRQGLPETLLRGTPIVLSERLDAAPHCRTVLNLSAELLEDAQRFDRVLELVSTDPEQMQAGRRRFKACKDRGFSVTHHEVKP